MISALKEFTKRRRWMCTIYTQLQFIEKSVMCCNRGGKNQTTVRALEENINSDLGERLVQRHWEING